MQKEDLDKKIREIGYTLQLDKEKYYPVVHLCSTCANFRLNAEAKFLYENNPARYPEVPIFYCALLGNTVGVHPALGTCNKWKRERFRSINCRQEGKDGLF